MPTMKLEIVTAERLVYEDQVNVVVAPGIEGQLGILPHHAALLTTLRVNSPSARMVKRTFTWPSPVGFWRL